MAIAKVILNGDTLMDVTSDTVAAGNMLSGITATKNDGTKTTGNIASKSSSDLTANNLTVIAPSGYYASNATKTLIDANLVAGNIKKNVSIFGVTGSYEGGGTPSPTPIPIPTPTPWVRPSDWPNLSAMDISVGDIIYMTSYADEARGFCDFYVRCTGSYTVELGSISGTTFTADNTYTYESNNHCQLYYGSANGTYKVLRVTGTDISYFCINGNANPITIGNFNCYTNNQGIIDVVGKLPSCTNMLHSNAYNLVNIDVDGLILSGQTSAMFSSCTSLTSLDVSGWDTGAVTSMSNMFQNCYSLASLDVSGWDMEKVTNTSSIFRSCFGLNGSLTLPSSLKQIGTYCFATTRSITEYHFLSTTPPTLSSTNAFNYMTDFGGKKIYVPAASLTAYQTASNWSSYASYMVGE